MLYEDFREKIQSGDLLAWSHRECKSLYDLKIQIVRAATRSEYSHVGIAWVVAGRVFVIESVIPKVRIVPLSNLLPCHVFSLGKPLSLFAEQFALSKVGKAEYSQWEAIKAFFGKNNNPDLWECAEFVKRVLEVNNVNLPGRDVPSDVVQSALEICTKHTYVE